MFFIDPIVCVIFVLGPGFVVWFLLHFISSLAIILLMKLSWLRRLLRAPSVGLRSVIVAVPGHTHIRFRLRG